MLAAIAVVLATTRVNAARQTEELMISPGQYSYRYLLYLPPTYTDDAAARWPLMVMLHGSGAVGQPMGVMSLAGPGLRIERGGDFPTVVVSPQCDTYNWDPTALAAFIDDIASLYRIDRDRIYVTGMSMGGYGTWNLATAYPDRYAAIAPVCGGGNPSLAHRLRDVAVWAFHGAVDTTVPLARSQEMIDAIRAAGGEPRFTIYAATGHDAWTPAYNDDELYAWMFAQNRANGPEITLQPETADVGLGASARLTVAARGAALHYQWLKDGFPVAAFGPSLELAGATAADTGDYSVVVSNSRASTMSRTARLTVLTPPAIVRTPCPVAAAAGSPAMLHVDATGGELTFAWEHDGQSIPGANLPTLSLPAAQPSDAGTYTVTVTNLRGQVSSAPARLDIQPACRDTRIINLSVRAGAGTGDQTLIIGLTVGGGAAGNALPVLLRGVGPGLRGFGVSDSLADPALLLFDRAGALARNGDWNDDPLLAATGARVGAFPLAGASRDAALLRFLPSGSYTAHAGSSLPNGHGIALLECYDASGPPTVATPQLINISARAQVTGADGALVAGFVVSGPGTRQVLVRGLGPALSAFGVSRSLPNPKVRLFRRGVLIAENDDWAGTGDLRDAATATGAGQLASDSRDAALLATVPAGVYSAHVVSADPAAGVALVEVFVLP